jgi:hypothetical protein
MPESTDRRGWLSGWLRAMRDERGEVDRERLILTTWMVGLALPVIGLGGPQLVHLLPASDPACFPNQRPVVRRP